MRTPLHARRSVVTAIAIAGAHAACQPAFEDRPWLVSAPRIVGVRAEPAEAAPGQAVTYEAIVVDARGRVTDAPLDWAACEAPKPLAENGAVNAACAAGDLPVLGGASPTLRAPLPGDACALFGPDPPPGGYRPCDADGTGGYFVPIRVRGPGIAPAFALERVTCALGNASFDVARAFGERYHANVNPVAGALAATVDGQPAPPQIPRGARVHLSVRWDEPERYVAFDPATQALIDRREAMRVAWLATGGAIAVAHTGRDEGDPETSSDDDWTASDAGPAHLWAVVRDSRGGVDVASLDVEVAP
jgi:hypothetical protein